MASLATLTQLGVRLGLDLTGDTRAQAILDDVSAAVVGYTGRTFTSVTETVTVEVCCGIATLPEGPVTAVTAVEADGEPVDFTWTTGRKVMVFGSTVEITYTHGYATVPADVVAVVCQIAGRSYGANPQNAGSGGEQLGDWQQPAYSPAGAAGPLGMMNDERAVLDRYRAGGGPRTIQVQAPVKLWPAVGQW